MRAGELDCIALRSDQSRDSIAQAKGQLSELSPTAYANTLKESFAWAFLGGQTPSPQMEIFSHWTKQEKICQTHPINLLP